MDTRGNPLLVTPTFLYYDISYYITYEVTTLTVTGTEQRVYGKFTPRRLFHRIWSMSVAPAYFGPWHPDNRTSPYSPFSDDMCCGFLYKKYVSVTVNFDLAGMIGQGAGWAFVYRGMGGTSAHGWFCGDLTLDYFTNFIWPPDDAQVIFFPDGSVLVIFSNGNREWFAPGTYPPGVQTLINKQYITRGNALYKLCVTTSGGYDGSSTIYIRIVGGVQTTITFNIGLQYANANIDIDMYMFNCDDPNYENPEVVVDSEDCKTSAIYKIGTHKSHTLTHNFVTDTPNPSEHYCSGDDISMLYMENIGVASHPLHGLLYLPSSIYNKSFNIDSSWLMIPNGMTRYRYNTKINHNEFWGRCINHLTNTVSTATYASMDDFPEELEDINPDIFFIDLSSSVASEYFHNVYMYDVNKEKYKLIPDVIAVTDLPSYGFDGTEIAHPGYSYYYIKYGQVCTLYQYNEYGWNSFSILDCVYVTSHDQVVAIIRAFDPDSLSTITYTQVLPDGYDEGDFIAAVSPIHSHTDNVIGSLSSIRMVFMPFPYTGAFHTSYIEVPGITCIPPNPLYTTTEEGHPENRIDWSAIFVFPGTYTIYNNGYNIFAIDVGGLKTLISTGIPQFIVKNPKPSVDITYVEEPLEKGQSKIIITRPHEYSNVLFNVMESHPSTAVMQYETLYTKTWSVEFNLINLSGNYVTNDIITLSSSPQEFCALRYAIEPIESIENLGQILTLKYSAENDDFTNEVEIEVDLSWPTPISRFIYTLNDYVIHADHDELPLYHSCTEWSWKLYNEEDELIYETATDAFDYTVSAPGIYRLVHTTSNPDGSHTSYVMIEVY